MGIRHTHPHSDRYHTIVKQNYERACAVAVLCCFAPEELFGTDWNSLSRAAQEYYETHDVPPCEGDGIVGTYCVNCPFGTVEWE